MVAMPKKQVVASQWRTAMRELFGKAEFVAAGEVYDRAVDDGATPSADDDLLRARILLKQDENRAVAFLIRRPPRTSGGQQRGRWELWLAVGYSRMRDFERADHHFSVAQRLLTAPEDKAQLAYQLARRSMLEGKLNDAWRYADEMSLDRSQDTKIRREMLRSFIFCHEEHYREAAQTTIDTIRLIGKRREEHLEEWYYALQNVATLGRELSFDEAADVARKEIDADVPWSEDHQAQRFQALKAIGWSCALRGDMLGCFRYLRFAERVIPSAAFAVILLLDRAHFARIVGETNWALDEIAKAESIAEGVDWQALVGEERVGLLLLAEATASIDRERGRYYLARYKALDKMRSPIYLFAFDHRLEAYAAYAEGVVRLAANDTDGAEEAFRKAWSTFDRIGYDWRAARAAIGLLDATKKERWRHLAEDKLQAFPRSWLARDLRDHEMRTIPTVKLPPMQNKVFTMLCQKMTTAEIAQELGLSQHTVRNHLKAVFRAYRVNNRAALVAEAAARGELPPPNKEWSTSNTA
jgi:DNA-binding CsgD family transcriptional regulator